MTDGEQQAEIAAMVAEKNALRREICCLENKQERIRNALSEVLSAMKAGHRLSVMRNEGIVASGDGAILPPVESILETQNRLLDARKRLEVVTQRLDGV